MVGTVQNNTNFNHDDFYESSAVFGLNDATVKSVSSDSGSATPSAHVLTIAGTNGVTTSGAGSTITVDGSGIGGSGDWVLISSATAADSATINFTGLSSTYFQYVVVICDYVPATDNTNLYMRTSTDGGTNYDAGASDYAWTYFKIISSTSSTVYEMADSEIQIADACGTSGNETLSAYIELQNPSLAGYGRCFWRVSMFDATAYSKNLKGVGSRLTAANIDAIRFLSSSGNIASGVFKLYGVLAS